MFELIAAASATALATGLGAIPVFAFGHDSVGWRSGLLGFAAGVMAVAAISGLLLPGIDEGPASEVWLGAGGGVLFLLAVRRWLVHADSGSTPAGRVSLLVFAVLLVHSLPEWPSLSRQRWLLFRTR